MGQGTDDPVERLARVEWSVGRLVEAVERMNGTGDRFNGEVRSIVEGVREALAGVTLSAPAVAPSPLEAAAEAAARYVGDDKGEMVARAVLAAAVGALPVNARGETLLPVPGTGNNACINQHARAALLAALTEERA